MANENKIEAEVSLDHRQVQVGVSDIVSQMTRMDRAVLTSAGKFENNLVPATRNLRSANGELINSLKSISSNLNSLSLSNFSNQMDALATKGQTVLGGIIRSGQAMQGEFNKVQSIAKFDDKNAAAYAEQLRVIGRDLDLGVKPAEATAAAYQVLSTGFTQADSSNRVLTSSLKLAKAGYTDTALSVGLLGGTLNSFKLQASQSDEVAGKFLKTVALGKVELPQMAAGLGRVSATAANAGVSLDELLGVVAASTQNGVPFETVISGMGGAIGELQKPSEEAKKELAALGLTVNAGTLKAKGFVASMKEIGAAIKARGNDQSLVNIFGGETSRVVVSSVFDDGQFAGLQKSVDAMKGGAAELDQVTAIMSRGSEEASKRMTAAWETFATGVAQRVEPALTGLFNAGTQALTILDRLPGPVKDIGLAALGLATGLGLAGKAIGFVSSGLVALRGGTVLAGAGAAQATKDFAAWRLQTAAIQGQSAGLSGALSGLGSTAIGMGSALVIAGIATAGITQYFVDIKREVNDADIALSQANRGVSQFFGAWRDNITEIRKEEALLLDAGRLADLGVKGTDIGFKIAQERNKLSGDTDPEERKKIRADIEALEKKRIEVDKELEKRTKASDPVAKEARLQDAKSKFKDQLQEIEIADEGHKKKLANLRALEQANRDLLAKDEALRRDVHGKILREEIAGKKAVAAEAKKAADEAFKQELQNAAASKKGTADQITDLQDLAKKYEDNGDRRRRIEDQIRQHEQALQKQREQDIAKLASLKEKAANDERSRSEARVAELNKLRERGVDTFGATVDELANQGRSKTDAIDSQLEKDLAKEKNPQVRAELKRQAKLEKEDVEREFSSQGADLLRSDQVQRLSGEQSLLDGETRISNLRIGLLQTLLEKGKDVQGQLREAVLERLALQEREIKLQADLVKAQTSDPRVAAQAEREAQAQILDARRSATEEIHRGTEALKAQKAAKDQLKEGAGGGEFSGRFLSIDQFIAGEQKRFDFKAPGAAVPTVPGINVRDAERAVLDGKRLRPTDLAGAASRADTIKVDGKWVIELVNERGEKVAHRVREVTVDGRGSKLANAARGMSGKSGLGGL